LQRDRMQIVRLFFVRRNCPMVIGKTSYANLRRCRIGPG
jgi:hypothetical protein